MKSVNRCEKRCDVLEETRRGERGGGGGNGVKDRVVPVTMVFDRDIVVATTTWVLVFCLSSEMITRLLVSRQG